MASTKLLYLTDSYQKIASAKIVKVETTGGVTAVTLNQTIFYPTGGGQLFDTGTIVGETGSLAITEVLFKGTAVIHYGKLTGEVAEKQPVQLNLNWDRRYQHMQEHTAGHILDEAVKELIPEHHGIKGMHGIGKKFYITFTGFIDTTFQEELQAKIDAIIQNNEPISSRLVTKEVIEAENIYIPFKLPENKPLRIIKFGDRDPVPDGGTQLQATSDSWPITLTDFTYGEGFTTIHYRVEKPVKTVAIKPLLPQTDRSGTTLITVEVGVDDLKHKFSQATLGDEARTEYLGKKGLINQLAKAIPTLPIADRAAAGKHLNELKNYIEQRLASSYTTIEKTDWLDVSAPAAMPPIGHMHLISEAISDIETIFSHLGFVRRRYPEIETDWYYAEGLNIPKNHPARDDQETFYFSESVVLTAHTSNGQLREMEYVGSPPIKMINIGKTYRRQASNTHSPMFHQFEGLLVDKNINITHLIGVSNYFAQKYFGPDREIRLRPHHFQFTEPSFEVDINCHICKGRGVVNGQKCKVCKSGWLELGGAGMVHPVVLKNGGVDPDTYSGFAFGWGVERVIMMKHQVTDNLRELYTDDLRFLEQS